MERTPKGHEVKSYITRQYERELLIDSYDSTSCELELWALVQAQEREIEARNSALESNREECRHWATQTAELRDKLQAQEEHIGLANKAALQAINALALCEAEVKQLSDEKVANSSQ